MPSDANASKIVGYHLRTLDAPESPISANAGSEKPGLPADIVSFVAELREKHPALERLPVLQGFPYGLEGMKKWAVVALLTNPQNPSAIDALHAIGEYESYVAQRTTTQ